MAQGPLDELPDGAEMAPEEFQNAVQAADRARLERIIDKAASDPAWKRRLLEDPEDALAMIGESGPPVVGEVAGQAQAHRTKWVWQWTVSGGWGWFHWR